MNNFLAAIKHSIDKGTFDYTVSFPNSKTAKQILRNTNITTIKNYLLNWFEIKQRSYQSSTKESYLNIVNNFLIPEFGNLSLFEIKKYHIKQAVNKWDVGKKLTRTRLSVLRTALDDAVDDELIEINPLHGWGYYHKIDEPVEEETINPFESHEVKSILNNVNEYEINVFQTLFFTGLRPSELISLKWSDIDFNKMVISITKSQTDAAIEPEITKTKSSKRDVKILKPTLEALKRQKRLTFMFNDRVFINPRNNNGRWTVSRLYKIWTKALIKADLKHRKMYQTRHTYASMMLSAGEPLMWVAQQMGHSNWVLLGKIYAKWIPEANPNTGDKGIEKFWN